MLTSQIFSQKTHRRLSISQMLAKDLHMASSYFLSACSLAYSVSSSTTILPGSGQTCAEPSSRTRWGRRLTVHDACFPSVQAAVSVEESGDDAV